jgi:hypothetical protein
MNTDKKIINCTGYYILGPKFHEDPMYWNKEDHGWVIEFENATPFSKDILTSPMPRDATCIMKFSNTGEPLAQFDILPLRGLVKLKSWFINFFHKSY